MLWGDFSLELRVRRWIWSKNPTCSFVITPWCLFLYKKITSWLTQVRAGELRTQYFPKVILDILLFLLFTSLRFVIGPENSHYPLNQSDLKLKLIATWSPAFSRALSGIVAKDWENEEGLDGVWSGPGPEPDPSLTRFFSNRAVFYFAPLC